MRRAIINITYERKQYLRLIVKTRYGTLYVICTGEVRLAGRGALVPVQVTLMPLSPHVSPGSFCW
jgi:hypothetical protein